jgi:hypothetical protein
MAGRNKNRRVMISSQNPRNAPAQKAKQKLSSLIPSSDNNALAILQASISPVSFWPPDYAPPHSAWLEHAPFAFWLIETLRPRILVELGTHGGLSYFAFCQAVQRLQLDTCCYAVDTWKGDEHAGFYGEEVFRDVRKHNDQRYSAFSTLIRSTFDEASHHFRKQSIDLLHIDGRHFYDDVKHDFETWQPKLSNRAVVIFHDTNVRERDFGVFALWRELCHERPHFEFFHGHGLGILGIGNDLPDRILALFAARANVEASTQIRRAYSRLGSAVTFQVRSEQVQLAAESQVAGLNKALAERDATVAGLNKALAERDAKVAALDQALSERNSKRRALQQALAEWDVKVFALDQALSKRNSERCELQQALAERDAKVAALDQALSERNSKRRALQQALAEWDAKVFALDQARAEVGDASRRIGQANFNVDRYVNRLDELGHDAIKTMRHRAEDFATLRDDPLFNADLFLPFDAAPTTRDEAIIDFLTQWANVDISAGAHHFLGRPCAGFHPQIYAYEHIGRYDTAAINPLAHFIRSGKPDGPWIHDVITPASPRRTSRSGTEPRVALHAHFFYPELVKDFVRKIACCQSRCDLLLSTDNHAKASMLREGVEEYESGKVLIRVVPNRGRDVGPLLGDFAEDVTQDYDIIGHVHGKRSVAINATMGERWREFLWQNLIGDAHPMMDIIIERFVADARTGIVFPNDPHLRDWDQNRDIAEDLAKRMGINVPLPPFFEFPIGTMFWARVDALRPLFELKIRHDEYPEEPVPGDGTILHALERLLPFVAKHSGYRLAVTHIPGVTW